MEPLSSLSPEDRYARHALIDWWDQKRLTEARILVAGAGAVGNEVIKLLALLGVGHLLIVDFDRVEMSNLTRSVLFRESDLGKEKAQVAAERAREINPNIEVRAIAGDLEYDVGLGVYRGMDVVLGCLDSIGARLALNRACQRAGVPWLNAGIEATLGSVALYPSGQGACFECGVSPTLWEQQSERFSCSGLQRIFDDTKMPTTAIVSSIVAGYLVNEALFLLHREPGRAKDGLEFGQQLYVMLKPYRFTVHDLPPNPDCLAHEIWSPVEIVPCSPRAITARDLLERARMQNGSMELGFDLLVAMRCWQCGQTETVLRPLERCSEALNECPRCQTATRQPETINWLEASDPLSARPLADFGIPEYAILSVKDGTERRFFQLTGAYSMATGYA